MTAIFAASGKPISLDLPTYPRVSDSDIAVKTAWGFSLPEWLGFTDQQRAYYRENVTSAPAFQSGAS